ncbi:hypothetical protein [Cupriavidus sp. DL-D2]|uniref:hypothetical protein n=1 Tax=Cupriavidus sp. DL-D2 TaxID=3144974 RepID=UPI00321498E2
MSLPIFNEVDQSTLKPGLYLALFHGRDDKDDCPEDWGFNGPMIGPIEFAHTTYGTEIKIKFERHEDWLKYFPEEPKVDGFRYAAGFLYAENAGPDLDWVIAHPEEAEKHPAVGEVFYKTEAVIDISGGELAQFDGKFYGDWTVFKVPGPELVQTGWYCQQHGEQKFIGLNDSIDEPDDPAYRWVPAYVHKRA